MKAHERNEELRQAIFGLINSDITKIRLEMEPGSEDPKDAKRWWITIRNEGGSTEEKPFYFG